jgi:hypothetical protein
MPGNDPVSISAIAVEVMRREAAVSARRPSPSKSKQNQINPSKNAWICLVLFGTYIRA